MPPSQVTVRLADRTFQLGGEHLTAVQTETGKFIPSCCQIATFTFKDVAKPQRNGFPSRINPPLMSWKLDDINVLLSFSKLNPPNTKHSLKE